MVMLPGKSPYPTGFSQRLNLSDGQGQVTSLTVPKLITQKIARQIHRTDVTYTLNRDQAQADQR